MKTIRLFLVVLTMIILTACNTATQALPTLSPTITSVPPTLTATMSDTPLPVTLTLTLTLTATTSATTSATPLPLLTEDMLKNATYQLSSYPKTVTLKEGKYDGSADADQVAAVMLPQIAFGDLNGDGLEDAAVLIAENGGGSGSFVSVFAILNQAGKPLQSGAALIDDRANIKALSIKNGQISVDALIHGTNDAMANPTLAVTENYIITKSGLKLVHFISAVPGGGERSIQIASPVSGSQASGSVEIKGSMPIAPFENSLAYRFDDQTGHKLAEGALILTSQTAGGPATFDNTLTLPSLASGDILLLELSENSAADGSTLALDAILLTIK